MFTAPIVSRALARELASFCIQARQITRDGRGSLRIHLFHVLRKSLPRDLSARQMRLSSERSPPVDPAGKQRPIFNTAAMRPLSLSLSRRAVPELFPRPRFRGPGRAYPRRQDPVVCTRDNGRAPLDAPLSNLLRKRLTAALS